MFNPQSLVTVPRDRNNVKLANMEVTEGLEQGGRWYRLIDERDKQKYRVLSEEDMQEELNKSKSYADSFMKRTVKNFTSADNGSPSRRLRKSAMVGVNSRSRTAENIRWKDELETAKTIAEYELSGDKDSLEEFLKSRGSSSSHSGSHGQSTSTYMRDDRGDSNAFPTISKSISPTQHLHGNSSHFNTQLSQNNDNSPLAVAIETMSEKYMENINVIKMLFSEKTAMEAKIKKMEKALRRSSSSPGRRRRNREDGESLPPEYDDIEFDDDDDDGDKGRGNNDLDYSDENEGSDAVGERSVRRGRRHKSRSRSPTTRDSKVVKKDLSEGMGLDAMAAAKMFDDEERGVKRRPCSAPPTKFQISGNLQSTIDRFMQHRKGLKIQEELARTQEEYEQLERAKKREERLKDAKEFEGMAARTKELEEKKKKEKEEMELKRKDIEDLEKEKRMREKKKALEKPVIKHEIAFEDYMEQLEIQRKERVHKRVSELKATMKDVPVMSVSASKDGRSVAPSQAQALTKVRKYEAELKKVINNIGSQQSDLERKIQEAKAEARAQSAAANDSNTPKQSINFVASMEARNRMYEAKQADRKAEKEKKDLDIKLKLQQEEATKFQKLLNAKIPEESRKTTKSVSIRASLVKEKLDHLEQSQKSQTTEEFNTKPSFKPKRERKSLQQRQDEAVEITKAHIEAVKKLREIEEEVRDKNSKEKNRRK